MSMRCATLLALALVAAAAQANAVAPPPCAGVRFLGDGVLLPGPTLPFDVVIVDAAGYATIASGCPPGRARGGRRAGVGSFRVHWATCGTLRNVRLAAKVDDHVDSVGFERRATGFGEMAQVVRPDQHA